MRRIQFPQREVHWIDTTIASCEPCIRRKRVKVNPTFWVLTTEKPYRRDSIMARIRLEYLRRRFVLNSQLRIGRDRLVVSLIECPISSHSTIECSVKYEFIKCAQGKKGTRWRRFKNLSMGGSFSTPFFLTAVFLIPAFSNPAFAVPPLTIQPGPIPFF